MSVNYASNLSPYSNKGVCGLPEIFDSNELLEQSINTLVNWIKHSTYTVVHTGAGLSTSTGIPDFRGPNGVWTLEKQGKSPIFALSFDDAIPSPGHMAIVSLEQYGYINYLITQNIDGLHLRSGFPRNRLSILHGDMYLEKCNSCNSMFVRSSKSVSTIGLKKTGFHCASMKTKLRSCNGSLTDTVLDWEDELTEPDYSMAIIESRKADLHICFGSSLQIIPAANLPFLQKNNKLKRKQKLNDLNPDVVYPENTHVKVVIVNLQPTKMDRRADLCIRATTDDVLVQICARLQVPIFQPKIPFVPKFILRSSHTAKDEVVKWKMFSHPSNESSPIVVEERLPIDE